MDDRTIISLFWQRNEQAIAETQQAYGKFCYLIANRILSNREDAEECVNDAYLALWNSIPPEKPQHFSAFLGKIVRNLSLKKYRTRSTQKRSGGVVLALDELSECIPDTKTLQEDLRQEELARLLDEFLRSLPENERNIFLRRYWFFDSIADICERYDCKESKIKMTLFRTRKKLYETLKKEELIL